MKTEKEITEELKAGTITMSDVKQIIADGDYLISDKVRYTIAAIIAKKINGKVWFRRVDESDAESAIKVLRVYSAHKGSYLEVNADGLNIDSLNRSDYAQVTNIMDEATDALAVVPTYRR